MVEKITMKEVHKMAEDCAGVVEDKIYLSDETFDQLESFLASALEEFFGYPE